VRNGHLGDDHCLNFVPWSLAANDCNHRIQFGQIDCAITLSQRISDALRFNSGGAAISWARQPSMSE
jgi:hypothetical protein